MHAYSVSRFTALLMLATPVIQAASNDTPSILEEIMVTADRRQESTLEVPSSLQVLDTATIEFRNYENTEELIRSVPNAHISQQRVGLGESNFSIRGVGTTTVNVDQTIGFYIDDIPVASVSEFAGEYFDVAQVEVLRGPQGTLYGRNALGGILHVKTNDPQPEQVIKLRAIYGSDNERRLAATFNSPLGSDTLMARVNILHSAHDARISNIALDAEDVDRFEVDSVRTKLLWLASERLSVQLSGELSDSEQTTAAGFFDNANHKSVNSLRPALLSKTSKGLGAKIEYELNRARFISLSSVRNQDQSGRGSRPESQSINPQLPFTMVFNNDFSGSLDQTTITQEFRLESFSDESLQWLIGAFFQRNKADRVSDILNVPTQVFERSFSTTQDQSLAAFTDLSYDINEQLSVTLGARYTRDKKELSYNHLGTFQPLFGFNFAPNQALNLGESFSDVSPRLVLEYHPIDKTHLYAKIARGYKAGGYNTEFLSFVNAPYGKESIWNYEVGFKTRSLNDRMELEASFFYMNWMDQQVLVFGPAGSQISNSKKSISKGLEIQSRLQANERLLITAVIGYVKAEFEQTPASLPVTGNAQPNSPEFSASLSARYHTVISENLQLFVDGDISHQSSFYWDVNNLLKEPDHTFVNLSMGVDSGQYQLSIFTKNLLNEDYRTNAFAASPGFFAAQGQPGHGRELGIKLEINY